MKRIISAIAAIALAALSASAQDLGQVTELFNTGATALSGGDKAGALKTFEQVLSQAEALGEEGKEIVEKCHEVIPNINLSLAKDLIKASDFDAAINQLKVAAEVAGKFNAEDVADEATKLIPQVLTSKANGLLNAKDYAGAAAAYKEVLASDPENGAAALRLGVALNATGDTEGAKAAFETAIANGQEATAKKQLGTMYLKEAAAALKAKKFADAVTAALQSNEYAQNPQAVQIAAQASQLGGKVNDAIKYFEMYLEMAPKAANAGQIAYTVGALYQQNKNNAKAKEFYTKALSDPKFGAEAQKLLDALK